MQPAIIFNAEDVTEITTSQVVRTWFDQQTLLVLPYSPPELALVLSTPLALSILKLPSTSPLLKKLHSIANEYLGKSSS